MTDSFQLSVLPQSQRALWPVLSQVPKRFVLYGGTAIALRLGHRHSVDFDFFTGDNFHADQLVRAMTFLTNARRIRESPDTLTVLKPVDGFEVPVYLSFFGGLKLGRIMPPDVAANGLFVASLPDLFGMKCATVSQRAEAKDYIDIHTIIKTGGLTLEYGIGAARAIYGRQYNAITTLKALAFFKDGNVSSLSDEIKQGLSEQVRKYDFDNVPVIRPEALIGEGTEPPQGEVSGGNGDG